MRKLKTLVLGLVISVVSVQAFAGSYWYQPTPYPLKKSDGTAMPQDLEKVHINDGWINSSWTQATKIVRDQKMYMGGWGDYYTSYLNFDLTGLPKDPNFAALYFWSSPVANTFTTPIYVCSLNAAWNMGMTVATIPTNLSECLGYYTLPTSESWWGFDLTSWYKNWKNGVLAKNGIVIGPRDSNNNNFAQFRSVRYSDFATDPYADGKRPILRLDFVPSIELKMPLPAPYSWLVTTEIGGYDCKGLYDAAHGVNKYFAIDFSRRSSNYPVNIDVPVLASGSGKILIAGGGNTAGNPNGYYVVIDHDSDGSSATGFQTWYVHLKDAPRKANGTLLYSGDIVSQGDKIGIMGNTGKDNSGNATSFGTHLHFAVKYQNDSSPTVSELTKVVMDGKLLKSYQTECSVDSNGWAVDWIKYYPSGNAQTGN